MSSPSADSLRSSSRREAIFVFSMFAAALVYTLGYCRLYGYDRPIEELTFVFGFPDWVFWGIVTPWFIAFALSTIFALWFMRDEPFGEDVGDEWLDDAEGWARPQDG